VPSQSAYNAGDVITRGVAGATESVTLPAINLSHLLTLTVDGGRVSGFHILPTSVVIVASRSEITLPAGSIRVVDSAGNPVTGAAIKLTPLCVPASAYDAFEARVEVLDSTGARIAYDAAKAFYPQGWTEAQIQQAVYSAYVRHYEGGGAAFFMRMRLTTPKGIKIWMRVSGNQSAAGTRLTGIATAYLDQGQNLTSSEAP
jgi:hypothetical protein